MLYEAPQGQHTIRVRATLENGTTLEAGSPFVGPSGERQERVIGRLNLPAGPAQIEAWVEVDGERSGPMYVYVERIGERP